MKTGKKGDGKLYDMFRASDEQIDFMMSEKGEMSLDRQIVKMMKDMDVDEIVQFTNAFFDKGENECSSLRALINKELGMRTESTQGERKEQVIVRECKEIAQSNRDELVSKLDALPKIVNELKNIRVAIEQDNRAEQIIHDRTEERNQDTLQINGLSYQQYVPKLPDDEDYLTGDDIPCQEFYSDIPQLPKIQIQKQQVQVIKRQQRILIIKSTQQNTQEQLTKQQSIKTLQERHVESLQNDHQIESLIPTTVQENQQLDFQEIQRIPLPDNKFKILYNNGDQYQGELQNQMKNGWGIYHYSTGQKYQGFFVDDQIQGYGQYFFLSGAEYQGDWSSGMKHGLGILKFGNGDAYQGSFVKDLFHGKGTYNYANGNVFTGTWKEGLKHGKGKFEGIDGSLQIGNWVNDKFQI